MKNKRGQFFLIAALVIIVTLSSIMIYQNRVKTRPLDDKIVSLANQISAESSVVIDYGVANNEEKLKDFLGDFSSDLLSTNPNVGLIFFFGNKTDINILNLANETINVSIEGTNYEVPNVEKTVNVGIGGGGISFNIDLDDENIKKAIVTVPFPYSQTKVTFSISGILYEILLDKYKNFYFVIKKEEGGETDVRIS